jgi:hypothetical protein
MAVRDPEGRTLGDGYDLIRLSQEKTARIKRKMGNK